MNIKLNMLMAAALAAALPGAVKAGEFEAALAGLQAYAEAPLPAVPAPSPAGGGEPRPQSRHSGYELRREAQILSMKPADIAAATPDQKVDMLRFLIRMSVTTEQPWQGFSAQDLRERMIVRLLASGGDAAGFDRLYYRVDPESLCHAVKDCMPIRRLAAAAQLSARPGDWDGLDAYISGATGADPARRNRIEFLVDGAAVIPEGAKALRAAQKFIHIELFQLQSDEIGRGLAALLAEKARAGVKVRLLLDAYGSGLPDDKGLAGMIGTMRGAGAEVITIEPSLLKERLDHRKIVVIDGKIGFTGGMNVGRWYQVEWHDQQTLVEGPAVAELQKAFLSNWHESGGGLVSSPELFPYAAEVPGGALTRVVPHDGGQDRNIKAVYLRAIATAQRSVRVANPYFTDRDVARALCAAARRGVAVQLVLPRENDQDLVQHASRAVYPALLKAGVEIYEYKGRMAHEKVATIDGRWSTLGSSNLDARSFRNNDELNLVIADEGVAADIGSRLFDADLKVSERVLRYSPTPADEAAGQIDWFL